MGVKSDFVKISIHAQCKDFLNPFLVSSNKLNRSIVGKKYNFYNLKAESNEKSLWDYLL
jgi:hypothetical protein